ncbi:hypothetical protein D3C75_877600 [compost metagenome]
MPNIIDLSTKIWQLQEINWLHVSVEEQKKWNRDFEDTVGLLIKKIEQNNSDASVLVFIKEKDKESFLMPVEIMFKVYQQIIILDYKLPDHLREFAGYLSFYGPDWEDEAADIIQFLGEGKLSEAKEVALGVDYDKHNPKESI